MRSAIGPNVVGAAASAVCDVDDIAIILADVDSDDGRTKLAALGTIVSPRNRKKNRLRILCRRKGWGVRRTLLVATMVNTELLLGAVCEQEAGPGRV